VSSRGIEAFSDLRTRKAKRYGVFFPDEVFLIRLILHNFQTRENRSRRKASEGSVAPFSIVRNAATPLARIEFPSPMQPVSPASEMKPVNLSRDLGLEDIQSLSDTAASASALQLPNGLYRSPTSQVPIYLGKADLRAVEAELSLADIQIPKSSKRFGGPATPPRRQGHSYAGDSNSARADAVRNLSTAPSPSASQPSDLEHLCEDKYLAISRGRSRNISNTGPVSKLRQSLSPEGKQAKQPSNYVDESSRNDNSIQRIIRVEPKFESPRFQDDIDGDAAGAMVIVSFIAISALWIILMAMANLAGGFHGENGGRTGLSKGFENMLAFTLTSWPLGMRTLESGREVSQTATLDSDALPFMVAILDSCLDGTTLELEATEQGFVPCGPNKASNPSIPSNFQALRNLHQPCLYRQKAPLSVTGNLQAPSTKFSAGHTCRKQSWVVSGFA